MLKLAVFWMMMLCVYISVNAQDSILYTRDFKLYEGIYTNYEEFRFNWPIDKAKIITKIPKDQLDFYSKQLEEDTIVYKERDGSIVKLPTHRIWGYSQNNVVFINFNKTFLRIPLLNAISNFIGAVDVENYSMGYNPYTISPVVNRGDKTQQIKPLLFDFYSGNIAEFDRENFSEFIKRDTELYNSYIKLNWRKQEQQKIQFLMRYNQKHFVYFPKG